MAITQAYTSSHPATSQEEVYATTEVFADISRSVGLAKVLEDMGVWGWTTRIVMYESNRSSSEVIVKLIGSRDLVGDGETGNLITISIPARVSGDSGSVQWKAISFLDDMTGAKAVMDPDLSGDAAMMGFLRRTVRSLGVPYLKSAL